MPEPVGEAVVRRNERKGKYMNFVTVLLLGIGLSMDAFAVAVCKGLAMKKLTLRHCAVVGLWFGGFQGLMPFIGYMLGVNFQKYIEAIAPWVAFVLLALIGGNMLKEAFEKECAQEEETDTLQWREMFLLAVATAIDALAVGITFICKPVEILGGFSTKPVFMIGSVHQFANMLLACGIIAVCTFLISFAGVKIGNVFGTRYKQRAEIAGGVILVLIGCKFILEHYGVL